MSSGFKTFLYILVLVVVMTAAFGVDYHMRKVKTVDCNKRDGEFTRIGKGAVCMRDGKIIKVYW